MHKISIFTTILLVCTFAPMANADTTDDPKALYDQGMVALNRGDFDIACPLLAKSYQLSPYPGTLFQWARCEDLAKRIYSASLRYQLYLDAVKHLPTEKQRVHADRAKHAETRLSALRVENATLRIIVPSTAPEGLIVKHDGIALPTAAFGMAIPVNLGKHLISIRRPDGVTKIDKMEVDEKKAYERVLEIPPPPPLLPKKPRNEKIPLPEPPPKPNRLRTAGATALSIGGAGFVTWGIAGGWGLVLNSKVEKYCKESSCGETGWEAYTKAQTTLNVASIGLGVGIGGTLAGTVMLLVNRKRTPIDPVKQGTQVVLMDMGLAGAGFGVRGVF